MPSAAERRSRRPRTRTLAHNSRLLWRIVRGVNTATGRREPPRAPGLVAAALSALRAAAPGQLWRTEDAGADRLRQRLASGRYDAILTRLEPPAPGHVQKRLAGDRLALAFAAADRPAAPVTPAILHGRPLIVRTHCEFLQAASRLLDDWQVRPQVVARTGDDGRALAMVAAENILNSQILRPGPPQSGTGEYAIAGVDYDWSLAVSPTDDAGLVRLHLEVREVESGHLGAELDTFRRAQ